MKRHPTAAITVLAIVLTAISPHSRAAAPAQMDPDPYGIVTRPVPEKTVVLSFDDGVASHATIVAPLLKKLGFGGSFYICDFDGFNTRKDWYMTWEQIKSLSDDGFDVGNHTKGHGGASLSPWLEMETQFLANSVPKPSTLCWPVYAVYDYLYPDLIANGYTFGRAGGDRPYRPSMDHPLDVPSFSLSDRTGMDEFTSHAQLATGGKIVVFTIHGVPEGEHMAVSLDPAKFASMMGYLKDNRYNVISMRDLGRHVDAAKAAKFLPFPKHLAWGGVTREDDRLYVSISKLPAGRMVTLPGMTTVISKAWFQEDPEKRPLKVSRADTGIQTITIPESSFVSSGEFPTVIAADLQGRPIATLLEFGFPGAPEGTISGNEIHVKVPLAADLTKLAPIYDTGSAEVTGDPASGAPNDFTRPQTYTITAEDGSTRRYLVTVTPTKGAVVVTNPGFEKFDSSGPHDITMLTNPSGATWVFTRPGNQGELGIKDLIKSPSAPPPPDGSRHSVFMRGPGNGVSQTITFDQGNYTVSLDVVKRRGYEKSAAPLKVTIDEVPVLTLASDQISEQWAGFTSPVFAIAAGPHTLAITLGAGEGMDLIDNVAIRRLP